MTSQPTHSPKTIDTAIDVIRHQCQTARVETTLPLALIEELDRRCHPIPRSTYLAQIIDAAMTRRDPHLPDVAEGTNLIDALASRRYRQHVRSIEIQRGIEETR